MDEDSKPQVGQVANGFYFTGTQWLAVANPSQATAYYVRAIALVMFGNIIATAGGFSAIASGGDDVSIFVVASIVALVFLVLAAINFFKGTSAQDKWGAFIRPRATQPTSD